MAASVDQLIRASVRQAPAVGRSAVDTRLHRLQWNEHPHDFPPDLKEEVLRRMMEVEWARYPVSGRPWRLIDRLARQFGLGADQVVVSEGSSDLLKVIMMAALEPGDRMVLPAPSFLQYGQLAGLLRAELVKVPLAPEDNYALPVDAIIAVSHQYNARLIVLIAPHNPTGAVFAHEDLRSIAAAAPGLVLIDEAYAEFTGQDLTDLLPLGNVVLVRTFSKVYALAGLRVGYLMTSPALAAEFQKLVTIFPLSVFSEIAAEVALDHTDRFLAQRAAMIAERERLYRALAAIPGPRVFPSATNFLLVQLPHPKHTLLNHLESAHRVLISDMAGYPELTDCVRISVGTPEQNDLVIQGFKELFGQ